jgi:tRNA1(Val) A37 N6-methylase TrmN6
MIRQPARGYRAGLDAVLLAAAVPVDGDEAALDLGAGVGVAGLCLAMRCPAALVTLVEREPLLADLARANAERNRLADRVTVHTADVADVAAFAPAAFAHVLANPPFGTIGRGRAPANPLKAAAHEMPAEALDDWARAAARGAAAGGRVTFIHRADALGDLLQALDGRFGALVVVPVQPRADAPAIRVLVQGVKGSRAPLTVAPGLVLHDAAGGFTPHVSEILRDGAPLSRH